MPGERSAGPPLQTGPDMAVTRSPLPGRRAIRIGTAVLMLGLIGGLVLIWRNAVPPTPMQTAGDTMDRVLAGDVDWVFGNATSQETRELDPAVARAFYDEFLRAPLTGAVVLRRETVFDSATKGVVAYQIRLRDGREKRLLALGYLEDGRRVVPVMESLLFAYASVGFDDPSLPDRLPKAIRAASPWLREHGVTRWYSTQDNAFYNLPPEG